MKIGEDSTRSFASGGKEANPSGLYLSDGRLKMGVPRGGDAKEEW